MGAPRPLKVERATSLEYSLCDNVQATMQLEHYADALTSKGRLRKPIQRRDSAPLHPNPIRRFREELRLTRQELAGLMAVPKETVRAWEHEVECFAPGHSRLMRLIELARRNEYPLYVRDIMAYAEKSRE